MFELGVYRRLVLASLRSQMQYRTSFLLDLFSTAFTTATEFASFALVFSRFGSIHGWSIGEVAFLYGLVELSFGIMDMLFSGFDPDRFGPYVREGKLDQFLLRPVSLGVQVLGADFLLKRLGRIALGSGIFLYAVSAAQVEWTPAKLAYLPLVVLGMVLFFGGLFMIGSTLTFWTAQSLEAMNTLTYGGSFLVSYPFTIYPDWLRHTFTYLVPAILLNYYPALWFLGKPDPFGFPPFAPFLAPVAGLVVFTAAAAFWSYGLRHYQSTGS
ncbi:MAG TPA: ABC-2 family transporter protein [Deinococcales bacterium]|nr:ABC-2 family transporter protein [Deinococcales bacterium]